jgi:hypothetical protein
MHYTDPLTIERLTAIRVDAARCQAQTDLLLRQAASVKQPGMSRRTRIFLANMGQRLAALGGWLEQHSSPRASY